MVGIPVSFWDGLFSGAMFQGVYLKFQGEGKPHVFKRNASTSLIFSAAKAGTWSSSAAKATVDMWVFYPRAPQ